MPPREFVDAALKKLDADFSTSNSPRVKMAQLYSECAYCLYREVYLRLKKIDEDMAGSLLQIKDTGVCGPI